MQRVRRSFTQTPMIQQGGLLAVERVIADTSGTSAMMSALWSFRSAAKYQ